MNIDYEIDATKYKMKFKMKGKSPGGDDYEVHILLRMFQYGDNQIYVDF